MPPENQPGAEQNTPPAVDFKTLIPEAYREMGIVKESPDIDTMFKRINDLNDYRGNSIRIPSSDAGAEQWAEFSQRLADKVPGLLKIPEPGAEGYDDVMNSVFKQLGRPVDAKGYVLPTVPEGVEFKAEGFKTFGETAHSLGLTQKQFDALASRELNQLMDAKKTLDDRRVESDTGLKKEWGDAYETKAGTIKNLLQRILPSVADTHPADFGLDTCKEFLALADKLNAEGGDLLKVNDGGRSSTQPLTPGEAMEKISDVRSNPAHPYYDRGAPGHDQAVKMMRDLHKAAYGL